MTKIPTNAISLELEGNTTIECPCCGADVEVFVSVKNKDEDAPCACKDKDLCRCKQDVVDPLDDICDSLDARGISYLVTEEYNDEGDIIRHVYLK